MYEGKVKPLSIKPSLPPTIRIQVPMDIKDTTYGNATDQNINEKIYNLPEFIYTQHNGHIHKSCTNDHERYNYQMTLITLLISKSF